MSSNKQKTHENNQRTVSRKKVVPVAEQSRQAKAPGAGPSRTDNEQSVAPEIGLGGSEVGVRGGPGAQQAGWSSRQQAERIEARAEESRLGLPQQSGYGGLEQDQHAGSQESPTGPPGSWQTGASGAQQRHGSPNAPPTVFSTKPKRGGAPGK
jgi:hypothetical protein